MRIVIVGLGAQGIKRQLSAGDECVATIDATNSAAHYKTLQELAINSYDAVFVCVPDEQKYAVVRYALVNKKHVLVEKPLFCTKTQEIEELEHLARANKVVCYAASNYRFEPYFVRVKQLLDSKVLGEIYHCRLSYGDNNAKVVLTDLGACLLDILYYWFGNAIQSNNFSIVSKKSFESMAPDHVIFADFSARFNVEVELTSLSWRNHFACDLIAENGSLHINSLCKWGTSSFLLLQRSLTGGSALEENETIVQLDPTLDLEYVHFKQLCEKINPVADFSVDQWIRSEIERLSSEELLIA